MYKEIEEAVKDINSHCPMQIDQTIRIDSCEALPENTIKYNYTFLYIDANKIDKTEFQKEISGYILYHIQQDEKSDKLKKLGVTFIYTCKDENNNSLGELTFKPEDYNKAVVKPTAIDSKYLNNNNLHKVLQEIVNQTQRQLPLFTEETGISMVYCRTFDKTLEYTCKLHNEDASRFDAIYFKTTGVPAAIKSLKDNPEMKAFAEQGVYISNIYLDKDGKYLCTITISPDEYL